MAKIEKRSTFEPYKICIESIAEHEYIQGMIKSGTNVQKISMTGFSAEMHNYFYSLFHTTFDGRAKKIQQLQED